MNRRSPAPWRDSHSGERSALIACADAGDPALGPKAVRTPYLDFEGRKPGLGSKHRSVHYPPGLQELAQEEETGRMGPGMKLRHRLRVVGVTESSNGVGGPEGRQPPGRLPP